MVNQGSIPDSIAGSSGDDGRDHEGELLLGLDFADLGDRSLRKVAAEFADAFERQAYVVAWFSAPPDVVVMTEGEKRHETIERAHLDRMTLRYLELQSVLDDRGWDGIGESPISLTSASGAVTSPR
jgi:hypothetical protein